MVSGLSLGGASLPPLIPSVRTQAITTGKSSQAVSRANAGTEVSVVPAGTEGLVPLSQDASALPPVNPAGESQTALMHTNGASPERSGDAALPTTALANPSVSSSESAGTKAKEPGVRDPATSGGVVGQQPSAPSKEKTVKSLQRYPGELPPAYQSPDQKAMEEQINNFVPNLWKASAAAVAPSVNKPADAGKSASVSGYNTPQPGETSQPPSGSVLNMRV